MFEKKDSYSYLELLDLFVSLGKMSVILDKRDDILNELRSYIHDLEFNSEISHDIAVNLLMILDKDFN